jgi:hypothetical protein
MRLVSCGLRLRQGRRGLVLVKRYIPTDISFLMSTDRTCADLALAAVLRSNYDSWAIGGPPREVWARRRIVHERIKRRSRLVGAAGDLL